MMKHKIFLMLLHCKFSAVIHHLISIKTNTYGHNFFGTIFVQNMNVPKFAKFICMNVESRAYCKGYTARVHAP